MVDAVRVLEEKNKDKKEEIAVFISELRKAGLLKDEFDAQDSRERVNTLKSKGKIMSVLFSINKNTINADTLL